MKLVFFAHPDFIGHKSMPRFAKMLSNGMAARGYEVDVWLPREVWSMLSRHPFINKWLGYIDQFIIFPQWVRKSLKNQPPDTLYIVTDQALGPWVPLIATRPHVIHCHDFIALHSALGEIPQSQTGWSGKKYQNLIRRGFSTGKNFISVSNKTKNDLHRFLSNKPEISEVVYNGLHQAFRPENVIDAREVFSQHTAINLRQGYILHVGGNIWYKNRLGVVEIYDAWRSSSKLFLPLLLIGEEPSLELTRRIELSPFRNDIHTRSGIEDTFITHAYSGATVMLFPSFDEGFGWPIAEAMAAGTLVITTGEAPMNEVAGPAGFFIDRKPAGVDEGQLWASKAARTVEEVVNFSPEEREKHVAASIANALRFNTIEALDKIESIYLKILAKR